MRANLKGAISLNEKREKPGRPINHPPIRIVETGEVYLSYQEAAAAIGGNKGAICNIMQGPGHRRKHKGYTFEFVRK